MQRGALPPLSTLQAFEAAGRLMSFTRAAEELNVTQAAVSKQIRALENHVGQSLFERSHRAVQLTAQGREYLHTVVTALNHLAHATLELRSNEAPQRLCIAADHSVAALWLLPRMKSLQASQPQVTFHLVVSDAESRSLADEVDVAILHGEDRWPLHQAELLFPEVVFPVCSPAYLAGAPPIRHMADLAAAHLIDLEDDNWTWINWRIWLTNHGVGLPATHKALTIGNYPLVLEASRQGLGIALAWQSLIEADLAEGTLTRPIDAEVQTRFAYYLAWPRTRQRSAVALAFCKWVQQQFGQSRL